MRKASQGGSKQQYTMRHDHSIIAYSRHVYMDVVLSVHPVRGEQHIQRNANREVAAPQVHFQAF